MEEHPAARGAGIDSFGKGNQVSMMLVEKI
jgi:hypothetical protein